MIVTISKIYEPLHCILTEYIDFIHQTSQFGYEYGLCSYTDAQIASPDVIPPMDKTKFSEEPYTLRQATLTDLPFLNRLSSPKTRQTNAVIGTHYTPEFWQYIVHDIFQIKKGQFDGERDTRIVVETKTGREVGYTLVSTYGSTPTLLAMALEEDVRYYDVAYSVMRQLFVWAKERQVEDKKNAQSTAPPVKPTTPPPSPPAQEENNDEDNTSSSSSEATTLEITSSASVNVATQVSATTIPAAAAAAAAPAPERPISFDLGLHEKHPFSVLLGSKAKRDAEERNPGFRMYTRISSYPHFILTVAPELESRIASSPLAGVSGRLRLDFFRSIEGCSAKGLEVVFEEGRITEAKDWTKPSPQEMLEEKLAWKAQGGPIPTLYQGSFPPLVFTMLVTGRKSLKELYLMYGDITIRSEETKMLLATLFPQGDQHLDIVCW